MKLPYLVLDVFTRSPLKGNPLAVVPDADHLFDDQMQAVAREFNLSETVFLCKPQKDRNSASVRIFTPHQELPFAGHPTVGAAVVLGLGGKATALRIEEKVGLVTALFEKVDRRTGRARFTLPKLPSRIADLPDRLTVAQALGISVDDIGCELFKPAVFSAGVTFHLVPVRNAEVLRRISVNRGLMETAFHHDHNSVYAFTLTPGEPNNDIAARMFAMGVGEDPGTGSAAAALIGLLAEQDLGNAQTDRILRQGVEMGRPCAISLHYRKENDVLVHGAIGGEAVVIGEGTLDLA
ncbi:MAG: PhzF family phenazine biosynthesis protein [Devosia sp.]|uniref:PhzF family phenazine biosynthesis protein n=1 Tax=Devosia sp. TaxID=1871048 RepID=UPI0024CD05EE|nr:PhzF family phenazine biosynthesis protein [Devosia sp.]UYO00725.1 MAG: PhzF family phenazine biosynthesis protein [Devosia sp.]